MNDFGKRYKKLAEYYGANYNEFNKFIKLINGFNLISKNIKIQAIKYYNKNEIVLLLKYSTLEYVKSDWGIEKYKRLFSKTDFDVFWFDNIKLKHNEYYWQIGILKSFYIYKRICFYGNFKLYNMDKEFKKNIDFLADKFQEIIL